MEIRVSFTVDEADYMNFQEYALDRNKSYKRTMNVVKYAVPVICSLGLVFISIFKEFKLAPFIVVLVLYTAISIFWVKKIPKKTRVNLLKKIQKKNLEIDKKTDIIGERMMTFTDEKISIVTKDSESTMNWNAVIGLEESPDFVLLFTSATIAYIIPKQKVHEWLNIKQLTERKLIEKTK